MTDRTFYAAFTLAVLTMLLVAAVAALGARSAPRRDMTPDLRRAACQLDLDACEVAR